MKYGSVIVTYNRKDKLVQALDSLLNQTYPPQAIYLVDNNSNDGTRELLTKKGYTDNSIIHYYRLDQNIGGSGGFYYGLKKAATDRSCDYLSISDDDAIFERDYFERINVAHLKYPDVKAFCGTVRNQDGEIQTDHRRKITNHRWIQEQVIAVDSYHSNFWVDTFSFVGCVISSEVIREIGLPRQEYFIYYDDTEYSLRVRSKTKVLNVSNAIVHHLVKSINNDQVELSWKFYYQIRNSTLMRREHSNWKLLVPYLLYNQLRLNYFVLTSSKFKGIRKRALKIYNDGFKDGMKGITGKNQRYLPGKIC